MKNLLSFLAIVALGILVFAAQLQWNAIWMLAPAVGGALSHNSFIQYHYADSAWEKACSVGAFVAALICGWLLGVYAMAAYHGIGSLDGEVLPLGGLISFAVLMIGAGFSWLTSPSEALDEKAATSRQPG